jgi:hypothetical protein
MRHPIRFVFLFVMALLVAPALGTHASPASADSRSEARAHYQAGVKAYAGGDYRVAIKEFSAAQQLAPADLNNYNLALCYDKLGEAEPAIQYYKEYLAKVPNADKRTEIEASVARLEGALQSAAAKRAEEQKRSEEARRAEQQRLDEEVRKAAEQKRLDDAKAAAAAKGGTGTATGTVPTVTVPTVTPPTGTGDTSVGSSGTPGTGQIVSTGDAQLDRAAAIDINTIRQQRAPIGTTGAPDPRGGQGAIGTGAGTGAQGMPNGTGQNPNGPQANVPRGADPMAPTDQPKKPTPIYKKWWFWAVVGVSAFVVYQIVSTDSNATTQGRQGLDLGGRPLPPAPGTGGATLLSW